ncbi:MAG: DUF4156 domain-containing protein [Gammaproteobacteria bacterium]|nr:DUF4156 domain-containing protein [Gammaproteobacteria bacterium]
MKYKIFGILLILTHLSACALMSLTEEGKKITIVNSEPKNNCQYSGEISVYTREAPENNFLNAMKSAGEDRDTVVKNRVAELGGSHAVLLSHVAESGMWFDTYTIYKCQ